MKKLLLVEVPDSFLCDETKYQVIALDPTPDETGWQYMECEYTEIQIPTDEEIGKESSMEYEPGIRRHDFIIGAKWLKSKIIGQ